MKYFFMDAIGGDVAAGAGTGAAVGGPWGAAIGAGVGLVGGLIQNSENSDATSAANAQNRDMMYQQMEFQERMADTVYQRGVADLKSAGLNPMLAYMKGGDPAPSGSSATAQAPNMQNLGTSAAQGAATGSAIQGQQKQNDLTEANVEKTNAQTATEMFRSYDAANNSALSKMQKDLAFESFENKLQTMRNNSSKALLDSETNLKYQGVDQAIGRIKSATGAAGSALNAAEGASSLMGVP